MILFSILLTLEGIFSLALRFNFLQPRKVTQEGPTGTWLSHQQTYEKYGTDPFTVPKEFLSEMQYDWKLQTENMQQKNAVLSPTNLSDDLANYRTASKTYLVSKKLDISPFQKIYEVEYTFDSQGRRKTFNTTVLNKTQKFVLALGDSLTFGEGVKDHQTYPSQLAKKIDSNFVVYNYGVPGSAINDFFLKTDNNSKFFDSPGEVDGIIIWVFFSFQLERTFCHLQCLTQDPSYYIHYKPNIFLDPAGKPATAGAILEPGSFKHFFFNMLRYSSFMKYLNLDFPVGFSENELDLYARIMAETFKNKIKKSSLKKFYFVNLFNFKEKEVLLMKLNEQGIQTIDYSEIPFSSLLPRFQIPVDLHPTPEFYWALSSLLKKDIFEKQ